MVHKIPDTIQQSKMKHKTQIICPYISNVCAMQQIF